MKFPRIGLRNWVFGQKNNEGPPDLDEVFRDLSNKINQLFGKGGNGGRGGVPSSQSDFPVLAILGVLALIWFATGFYIVDQGSRGVVLRFGKHVETTQPGPRWHFPYPIEHVEIVNLEKLRTLEVGYRSTDGDVVRSDMPRESLMLTDDENIIDLQFAVQFNLKSVEDFQFNNRMSDKAGRSDESDRSAEFVRSVAETAIREIVGKSKMDFALYEGREEIAVRAKKLMQSVLDRYNSGIHIVSVTMQNAQPPEQVQAAFDDAVKAKQDLERQKNEGQAYANDVIPKARGQAARLMAEANGYQLRVENEAKGNANRFEQILAQYNKAPEVTRQRLFIDAQEQILANSSKVLVDQKGGNSLLYLPLDKLMAMSSNNANAATTSGSAPATAAATQTQIEDTREALRNRERQ